MKAINETKKLAYKTLAANKHAKRPEEISMHQWTAIYSIMNEKYIKALMDTPSGLYSDSEVWKQTFASYLK